MSNFHDLSHGNNLMNKFHFVINFELITWLFKTEGVKASIVTIFFATPFEVSGTIGISLETFFGNLLKILYRMWEAVNERNNMISENNAPKKHDREHAKRMMEFRIFLFHSFANFAVFRFRSHHWSAYDHFDVGLYSPNLSYLWNLLSPIFEAKAAKLNLIYSKPMEGLE